MGESSDGGDLRGLVVGAPADDEGFLDTPNCDHCLTRMTAVDAANGEPYWRCASCGRARLA